METLNRQEQDVLDAIDERELLDDLSSLVAIRSIDGTPGEDEAQRWCAERLRNLGLTVDEWDIDIAAERVRPDFPGMEVERATAVGCVATLGAAAGPPAMAFNGHTDVVPPGELDLWPGGDPFTLRVADGLAHGRGACDMKAGVVAIIAAAAAVRRTGMELTRSIGIHCVTAEEDGGLGAYATLRRGHTADGCIIAEPTGGTVIPANAGSLTFEIVVHGLSTHGSSRTLGVSALDKLEVVQRALRSLELRRNNDSSDLFAHLDMGWPLSIGTVTAGDWASTVPDRLVATGRYGVRPGESLTAAQLEFEQALAEAGREDEWLIEHPVQVTWPGGMFAPGQLPPGHPLLGDVIGAAAEITGTLPAVRGAPYGSDLRHYAAAGVPTVQFGPGDVRLAHAADEYVSIAEMADCAKVYALLMVRASRG
ncbi:MAG: acetylornithine deacetylase or succinyl-diaminopimelate desuccinylase [Marmoricola sp.]|jgi:acetylornithine deacetylase|nr:acetylornithine deacetylase or succinyl-diaminopimelate desuccinylase [Marmoricola sp.]